MEERIG